MASSFRDTAGRLWDVSIDVAACKRVRSLTGVDIMDLTGGDPPTLTRLGTDLVLLFDVLYAVCKPQLDAAGVTDEQFGSSLSGATAPLAYEAFWSALKDFFQILRPEQAEAIVKQLAVVKLATSRAVAMLQRLGPEAILQQAAPETKADGEPSTSSPAGSA